MSVGIRLVEVGRSVLASEATAAVRGLMRPAQLAEDLRWRRARLILGRVRQVSAVFAVLTLLWIPLDLVIFPPTLAIYLAALRVMASLAFVILALSFRRADSPGSAELALVWLLAIPTAFFLISHPLLSVFPIDGDAQQVIAAGYAFLPFVMVAGLSMFPVTALEGALLCLPPLAASVLTGLLGYPMLPFSTPLGGQWLLMLLGVVATLAGMSQTHFLARWHEQAAHDPLTGAYVRRLGEVLLAQVFMITQRVEAPMTVILLDIVACEHWRDHYGHEDGDSALVAVCQRLNGVLRRGDILIRWGESTILAVMPNAGAAGAASALNRARGDGFGNGPDGLPILVRAGIAERRTVQADSWNSLVAHAERSRDGAPA